MAIPISLPTRITHGIFYSIFSLLEDACHKLDVRVVMEDSVDNGGATYSKYVETLREMTKLKDDAER